MQGEGIAPRLAQGIYTILYTAACMEAGVHLPASDPSPSTVLWSGPVDSVSGPMGRGKLGHHRKPPGKPLWW